MRRVLLFVVGLLLLAGVLDSALGPVTLLLDHLQGDAPPVTEADRTVLGVDILFALVLLLLGVWAIRAAVSTPTKERPNDPTQRSN